MRAGHHGMKTAAWLGAVVTAVLLVCSGPAGAGVSVYVPASTHVGLEFMTPVYTATAVNGNTVNFRIAADVIVNRYVVIKQSTPLTGTVTSATGPGRFGRPARVMIGYLSVKAVDRRPLALNGFEISPQRTGRAGAAGAMAAGALLTHSAWGLLGGALVKGNDVQVPVHSVIGVTTQAPATVKVP